MTDPHFHKDYKIEEKDLIPDGSFISVVPDSPAPEGTKVLYLNSGDFREYIMLDGVWRQVGGDSVTGIAFDNAAVVAASGSSTQTTAFTVTGDDPILFVAIAGFATDTPTAVSYNGVAMTLIDSTALSHTPGDAWTCYLYVLRGAQAGTHNISITMSGSRGDGAIAVSYKRTNQAIQPDASAKSGPTTTTHYTQSVTTTEDNCWAVMAGIYDSSLTLTPDSGTIIRQVAAGALYFCDSAVAKSPAGSVTLGLNSASQAFTGVIASFKPN